MKKSKYLSIVAAALLAVAPVAGTAVFTASQNIVKADAGEPTPGAVKVVLGLKKPSLTLNSKDDLMDQEDEILRNITTNHGVIDYDTPSGNFTFYKKDSNGNVNWGHPLDEGDTLKNGTEGVVIVEPDIKNLPVDDDDDQTTYTFLAKTDDSGNLVWAQADALDTLDGIMDDAQPAIKVPFVIGGKKSSTSTSKSKTYGYVTAGRNHRVRTYTSSGRFSRRYVYGHHTYRLSQRRHIRKHGTCYKLYGKNQYIPAKYLSLR